MQKNLFGGASVPDRGAGEILQSLNAVAQKYNVDPAAIAAMIHTESQWDTRCVTGSYIGLTQVGPELPKSMNLTRDEFLDLSASSQIDAYGKWLGYYRYLDQVAKYQMNVDKQPVARQAAVLQAMQFAPNGTKWKTAFARGDYSVRSTSSKQASFLGDTSIHDMEAYYTAFFKQHPPSYGESGIALNDEPQPFAAKAGRNFAVAEWAAVGDMASGADAARVATLIQIGSSVEKCDAIRDKARKAMVQIYGKPTLHNACACTLSLFLQAAGISVPLTFGAGALARLLEKERHWKRISMGQQKAGDVAVCRDDDDSIPGADHIFFIVARVDDDLMSIADNQDSHSPHPRYASGKGGKTPVDYFLRPQSGEADVVMELSAQNMDDVVTVDEKTDGLVAKFDVNGRLLA